MRKTLTAEDSLPSVFLYQGRGVDSLCHDQTLAKLKSLVLNPIITSESIENFVSRDLVSKIIVVIPGGNAIQQSIDLDRDRIRVFHRLMSANRISAYIGICAGAINLSKYWYHDSFLFPGPVKLASNYVAARLDEANGGAQVTHVTISDRVHHLAKQTFSAIRWDGPDFHLLAESQAKVLAKFSDSKFSERPAALSLEKDHCRYVFLAPHVEIEASCIDDEVLQTNDRLSLERTQKIRDAFTRYCFEYAGLTLR